MKTRIAAVALLSAMTLTAAACTVKKEEDGKLPEVKVEGGELPKVDVDPANVTVGQDTHTVVTPTVNVTPDTTKDKTND